MYPHEVKFAPDEVIVYLRKSRSDDPSLTVEEVLAKHEMILDDWSIAQLGALVPEQNRYREVVSGETISERPQFQEVLRRIESPKIKALLVVEVERISRGDLEDAGRLMKLFRYSKTIIITPHKIYDLQDEYDRDFFERELKRGNEYLEYSKKIMGRGRLLSVQQGNYIGKDAPYGYEKISYLEGKKKNHSLRIKEDEAAVVRLIFDLYVNQNLGYVKIARHLDNIGIKAPRGQHWSTATLRDLIENVHYIGKIKWNSRKRVISVEDSQIVERRPKFKYGEYLIYDGKHESIISEELFFAAMEKNGKNARLKSETNLVNPFAGLLFCRCGRAMVYRTHVNNGVEISSPRLLCPDQIHCHTSSCTYHDFLLYIVDILKKCIDNAEVQLQEFDRDSHDLHISIIHTLERQLEELERKEISLWEKYSEEAMPKQIFESLNAKVLHEKEKTQQALSEARNTLPNPEAYQKRLLTFQDAFNALQDPSIPVERQNKLLRACIERITYHREPSYRITKSMLNDPNHPANEKGWISPPFTLDVKLRI